MLLVRDWNVVESITALFRGNIQKYYIRPHPEFDVNDFPFLVCSGSDNYVLINVKEKLKGQRLAKFIDSSGCTVRG